MNNKPNSFTYNPLAFWEQYELVGSSDNFRIQPGEGRKCRFCGKSEPTVSFEQHAHLIPELLGRNSTISPEECDICNKRFGKMENHLAILVRPYFALLGIPTKKGIPIFQSRTDNRDEDTRTVLSNGEDGRRNLLIGKEDDIRIDETNGTAEIVFRKSNFKPQYAFWALMRIGLALLPDRDCTRQQILFDFLQGKAVDIIGHWVVYQSLLTHKQFAEPQAWLYSSKQPDIEQEHTPPYTLVVAFANCIFQLFLPESLNNLSGSHQRSLSLELFPGFAYDKLEDGKRLQFNYIDLSSNQPVQQDHRIHLSFGEVIWGDRDNLIKQQIL